MKVQRAGWGSSAIGLCWLVLTGLTGRAADPSPQLKLGIETLASEVVVSWTEEAAGSYVVEATPTLDAPRWETVGRHTGTPGSTATITLPSPAPTESRFFRLVFTAAPARGTLETNVLLRSYAAADLGTIMAGYGLPAIGVGPVAAWKVIYDTIDPVGGPTTASALVVVPGNTTKALPIVTYAHGTLTERESAPSRLVGEADIGLILGGGGYLAVLPDYLGLGDSPGFHPYQHAASEASAVLDALRAARALAGRLGVGLNGQLFITGYSQGGHAALAAHREIELHHTNEFTITASAPCAGAYDMSGVIQNDFLSDRQPPNPYYSAYLLMAYTRVYSLATNVADLLRAPYNTTLPPLFDGAHGSGQINAAMPAHPRDILKPELLAAFQGDPNHPLRLALRDNDLYSGWYPKVPTRMYHCSGDQDVLPANTQVASAAFRAAGATLVEAFDPVPGASHGGCAPFALFATKLWFDQLKH